MFKQNTALFQLLLFIDQRIFYSTLFILAGHKCSLDVATMLQGGTKFFSVLMLAWGTYNPLNDIVL